MLSIIDPPGSPRAQTLDPIRIFRDGSRLAEAIAPSDLEIRIPQLAQLWTKIEKVQAEGNKRDGVSSHVGRALFNEGGIVLLLLISPFGKRSVFVASRPGSIAHLALTAWPAMRSPIALTSRRSYARQTRLTRGFEARPVPGRVFLVSLGRREHQEGPSEQFDSVCR